MPCKACGYKRGHHAKCRRKKRPVKRTTTAADLVEAIRAGLDKTAYGEVGAVVDDISAAEIECDGGIWEVTVKRIL